MDGFRVVSVRRGYEQACVVVECPGGERATIWLAQAESRMQNMTDFQLMTDAVDRAKKLYEAKRKEM